MKKSTTILTMTFSVSILISSAVYSADQKGMTLSEKLAELGDNAFYVENAGCDGSNCNSIPYEHETEWFWLDKSEKQKISVRNIERRNKWLLESGLFPTGSEIKSKEAKAKQSELTKMLEQNRLQAEEAEKGKKENDLKLAVLEEKKKNLLAKRDKLVDKTRDIFNSTEITTSGSESLRESASGLIKGKAPMITSKAEDYKLDELEKSQKELRSVIKELRNLGVESSALHYESLSYVASASSLKSQIDNDQANLDKTVNEYGRAVANIPSEQEKLAAEVKLLTEKTKISKSKDYSASKIKELEAQGKFAEFIMRDFDSIKKDLKINELEAQVLLGDVEQKIQQSVLGQYIKKQNENTLKAALQGACQTAKACSQHDSVNNSNIKKDLEPVLRELNEQSEKSKQQ